MDVQMLPEWWLEGGLRQPDVTNRYSEIDSDIRSNCASQQDKSTLCSDYTQVETLGFGVSTSDKSRRLEPEPGVVTKRVALVIPFASYPAAYCREPPQIGVVNPLCVSYFVWNHWQKSSSGAPYWLLTALSVWAGEWRGRTAARHLTEKEPSSPGREAAFKLDMWVVMLGARN